MAPRSNSKLDKQLVSIALWRKLRRGPARPDIARHHRGKLLPNGNDERQAVDYLFAGLLGDCWGIAAALPAHVGPDGTPTIARASVQSGLVSDIAAQTFRPTMRCNHWAIRAARRREPQIRHRQHSSARDVFIASGPDGIRLPPPPSPASGGEVERAHIQPAHAESR